MKKETLEQAVERFAIESVSKNLPFSIVDFTNGYKLALERSYNEEDMRTAWNSSEQNMRFTFSSSLWKNITFEQWLEQFKKK